MSALIGSHKKAWEKKCTLFRGRPVLRNPTCLGSENIGISGVDLPYHLIVWLVCLAPRPSWAGDSSEWLAPALPSSKSQARGAVLPRRCIDEFESPSKQWHSRNHYLPFLEKKKHTTNRARLEVFIWPKLQHQGQSAFHRGEKTKPLHVGCLHGVPKQVQQTQKSTSSRVHSNYCFWLPYLVGCLVAWLKNQLQVGTRVSGNLFSFLYFFFFPGGSNCLGHGGNRFPLTS